MKKKEIEVGKVYWAPVNGFIKKVRVDNIEEREGYSGNFGGRKAVTRYHVTNLRTGRKTTFRSASKFRSEVTEQVF